MGIVVTIHSEVLQRHNPNTRFSHFVGKVEVLMVRTLAAWYEGKFRPSHRNPEAYLVKLFDPSGFYCMVEGRERRQAKEDLAKIDLDQVQWVKEPAGTVFAVVIIKSRSHIGAVTEIEIIDYQAVPGICRDIGRSPENITVRQAS